MSRSHESEQRVARVKRLIGYVSPNDLLDDEEELDEDLDDVDPPDGDEGD